MELSYSLVEIATVAKTILSEVTCKVILFEGEMGAGKTTLIKALAKQLGITEITGSPTYGFVNVYEGENGEIINHFDFYRMESDEEAFDMGIEEYFYDDCWNFIEWPSKALAVIPEKRILVKIEKVAENERKLVLSTKY